MDELDLAWRRAWIKPDRRQIFEWARSELNLQGDYRDKGPFYVETSRYLIKPFLLAMDDSVRMINILKAIQTGGSMIGDVFFQWALKNQPAAMMMTYQTDDDGEQHYLTRIEPTLKGTACNRPYFEALKKKRDLYQFPPMNVYIQGANMNSLQRKSVRYEVNDEVWDWNPGMLGEAWGRTEAYAQMCKIFNISQGGEEGSDWEYAYNGGKREDWGCKCLKCGHLQPLAFFGRMLDDPETHGAVVYDQVLLPDGRHDIDRCARSARFRCVRCGFEHPDTPKTWEAFNANGDYLCLDPDRSAKTSSVHWSSMVNGRYGDLVAEFLKAVEIKNQGSPEALKKFYLKKLAQFWSTSTAQEKIVLRTAGYSKEQPFEKTYKIDPAIDQIYGFTFIIADFQEGRGNDSRHFKVAARAWSEDGRSKLLWEGRLNSHEKIYELQKALGVKDPCVCVDGGHERNQIAAWCARYGWTVLITSSLSRQRDLLAQLTRHRKPRLKSKEQQMQKARSLQFVSG